MHEVEKINCNETDPDDTSSTARYPTESDDDAVLVTCLNTVRSIADEH